MSALQRRKRLPDGTFGELEKVFEGETADEKVARLEAENASLTLSLLEKDVRLETVESLQAEIMLLLIGGGGAIE